ncbi:MAG: LCP family protein [Candidatus Saccharimonadales bacterium]
MSSDKQDGFRPRRPANIDGFFAGNQPNRPRQPIFRSSSPDLQPKQRTIGEMAKVQSSELLSSPTEDTKILGLDEHAPRSSRQAETRVPKSRKPKRNWKRVVKRSGAVFGILILLVGGFFGARFYKDIARLTGNHNPFSLLGLFHPGHLNNQNGRVNILVAGNSADDLGHNGAELTDSIMILSLDTRTHSALMLSVPRDLWVNIPGNGHAKINAAYPEGGMNLLQKTIEQNLDIPINYQVLVNYTAFKDLVNAVGGITIKIQSPDPRGIYDPSLDYTTRNCCALAKYPNGNVNLNGKQALNLARARGDAYGSYGFPQADFDRTQHQRQMLLAVKDKASNTSVIANPLKVSKLVDAAGNNVRTNLSLSEIQALYYYTKDLNDGSIQSSNINTLDGKPMLASYMSPNGQSALIPAAGIDDFSDIQAQIKKLFSSDPVVRESANVVVLNATNTVGLATKQGNILSAKGMIISQVADASANQAATSMIDNSGGKKPSTLAALKSLYKGTIVTNPTLSQTYPGADFIILLGNDMVPSTTTQ